MCAFGAGFGLCLLAPAAALAGNDNPLSGPSILTKEAWAGADAGAHDWSAYSGMTSSFGSDIRQDGWRYRFVSGYGAYSYSSTRWTGSKVITMPFDGTVTFADALLGYQKSVGPLTIKAFAGLSAQSHDIAPFDIENRVQGFDWGVSGVVESWLNLGERGYGQLDLSYRSAFQTYGSRLRLGYRFWPQLSAGLEAGLNGNVDYDSGRAGVFLRYEGARGEISVSAGASGDRSDMTGAYATVNMLYRF